MKTAISTHLITYHTLPGIVNCYKLHVGVNVTVDWDDVCDAAHMAHKQKC